MTPAYYRERAARCLDAHPDLLPEGFQAVLQQTHDYGLLETLRGTVPAGLLEALRDTLAGDRRERAAVVLGPGAPAGGTLPGNAQRLRMAGFPVLAATDLPAALASLAAAREQDLDKRADAVLRSLGHLPPAEAQSPEAARRRVTPGTGLL